MAILDSYPLFTVSRLAASRDFFVRRLEMHVVFEATWVVMLSHRDDGSISLGLMASDHPSSPPGPEIFDGKGAIFTLKVDAAAELHARLAADGVELVHGLTDEKWGQRRFMVREPSGVLVDIVEQIDPAPGFWDPYAV
jgi:catechol 2,3-dioxygenase-like lactoylglutathione lyase family enzyme